MDKIKTIIPVFLLTLIMVVSCGKEDEPNEPIPVEPPTAAVLLFPENNKECNQGVIISETETEILFKWEASANTFSYILTVTNLNSGESVDYHTISTEYLLTKSRGTAYSWFVESVSGATGDKVKSEVWRFYNAGLPVETHPPFPAEVISPKNGTSINAGTITLKWETSDIDNDIASYKILFGTESQPVVELGSTSQNSFNVEVVSGEIYYWKVITTDVAGNISNSQIFQFKVN